MKSFATSICPIKKSSCLEYEASPRHTSAIPAPSPRGETITQPISKRFLSGVITGLRQAHPAQRYLRAIPAWRSGLLRALRHGDPAYRHFRAIPA